MVFRSPSFWRSSRPSTRQLTTSTRLSSAPITASDIYVPTVYVKSYSPQMSRRFVFLRISRSMHSYWCHQEPWFIKLNPNGRIPVLVDHSRNDFVIFETAAILLYLVQHYDKTHSFWFDPEKDSNSYSEMLQWIFFAVRARSTSTSAGPRLTLPIAWWCRSDARSRYGASIVIIFTIHICSLANHFKNAAPEDVPYGKKRAHILASLNETFELTPDTLYRLPWWN